VTPKNGLRWRRPSSHGRYFWIGSYLLFVLFPGIIPGAAALELYTLGVLGRLIADLDERPLVALKSVGAGGGKLFAYGVLPPTFPRFVGYSLYRWEETIRATVVVGLVGAGGLDRQLTEQLSSFDYDGVLATLLIFIGLIFLVDLVSAAVRLTGGPSERRDVKIVLKYRVCAMWSFFCNDQFCY
jgi:ABC-type phosphate/phosphonate transport system permease subunit